MIQGNLILVDINRTLFWGAEYFMDYHISPIHFLEKEMINNPIAIFLEFDYTGMYMKVLWNGRIGWINSISAELLKESI